MNLPSGKPIFATVLSGDAEADGTVRLDFGQVVGTFCIVNYTGDDIWFLTLNSADDADEAAPTGGKLMERITDGAAVRNVSVRTRYLDIAFGSDGTGFTKDADPGYAVYGWPEVGLPFGDPA